MLKINLYRGEKIITMLLILCKTKTDGILRTYMVSHRLKETSLKSAQHLLHQSKRVNYKYAGLRYDIGCRALVRKKGEKKKENM